MNDFDQRWQTLARTARHSPEEPPADLPPGFTTRVLARARESVGEPWEDVLSFLGLRAVLAAAFVFFLSAGFAYSEWFDERIEPPALETSLTSDLSWP